MTDRYIDRQRDGWDDMAQIDHVAEDCHMHV